MKKKIIIAGGSGFIGSELSKHYASQNYEVVILSRGKSKVENGISFLSWDSKNMSNWVSALEGAETLINLTGKSVDCRYTERNKKLILSSRIEATNVLAKAINTLKSPPKLWVNASTATIYQHSLYKPMTESNGDIGDDFSMTVAQKWEDAFYSIPTPKTRKVAARISLVLGNKDGVFPVLKRLAQIGLGGKHGSGKQMFAWIHVQDLIGVFDFFKQHPQIEGSINVTSPTPITNEEFMNTLRESIGIGIGIPTPKILLHIGCFILRTEPELILKSRYVIPKRLLDYGFVFKYNLVEPALKNLVKYH